MWPGLRTALSPEVAEEIGTKIAEGKKTAPARPHPHTTLARRAQGGGTGGGSGG